jgi:hypothetical protein
MQRRRRRGGALTQRPGDTTVAWRGSARAATTASSQRKSPTIRRRNTQHQARYHRGQGLATREQARGRHGRGPELWRRRGCKRPGSNRVDLADRQNHRRLIYRLSDISVAEIDGARRNRTRRRRGDVVARGVAREKKTRVSEGEEATGRTDRAASRARLVGWHRQVGLARQVGQGWQRER